MLNRVDLIGNLGADPEARMTPSGQSVTTLRVATTERTKGQDGEWRDVTDWHTVVVWGKSADFAAKYLRKGSRVFVSGKLKTRSWEDRQSGQKKYATEVVAERIQGLDGRGDQAQDAGPESSRQGSRGGQAQRPPTGAGGGSVGPQNDGPMFYGDDVPF